MSQELTKEQVCIITQNRAEIWMDKDKLPMILAAIRNETGLIEINGNYINPKHIEILTAQEMENITRRKNGQWQCKWGKWHEQRQRCLCRFDHLTGEELARECQM